MKRRKEIKQNAIKNCRGIERANADMERVLETKRKELDGKMHRCQRLDEKVNFTKYVFV